MDGARPSKRGTIRDWPAELMMAAAVMWLVAPAAVVLWVLLFMFGGVTLMARRGSFSPRR